MFLKQHNHWRDIFVPFKLN